MTWERPRRARFPAGEEASQVPDGDPEGAQGGERGGLPGPGAQGLDRRPKRGMTLAADHLLRSRLLQPCYSSLPPPASLVPPAVAILRAALAPLLFTPRALPSSPRLLSSPLYTSNSRALPCLFAHAPAAFVVGGVVGIRGFLFLHSSSLFLLTSRV